VRKQLGLIAHNAQVAATRLIQIPSAGSVPRDLLTTLLNTYVTLQGNLADVSTRVGTEDAAGAQKDAVEVQAQVQAFIDGVEAAIAAAVPAAEPGSALAPAKREIPWMLIGGGALGLVAVGIGVYQYQKANARAARAATRGARGVGTATGGAAASRKRKAGKKRRRHHFED
jgi:hypothetical protein